MLAATDLQRLQRGGASCAVLLVLCGVFGHRSYSRQLRGRPWLPQATVGNCIGQQVKLSLQPCPVADEQGLSQIAAASAPARKG